MRKVTVLEPANADAAIGWEWYEKRDPGAGHYFAVTVSAAVKSLATYHGTHPKRFGYFRMLVPNFPFGVFYRELADATEVVAVLDLRRSPSWMRRQLRQR